MLIGQKREVGDNCQKSASKYIIENADEDEQNRSYYFDHYYNCCSYFTRFPGYRRRQYKRLGGTIWRRSHCTRNKRNRFNNNRYSKWFFFFAGKARQLEDPCKWTALKEKDNCYGACV